MTVDELIEELKKFEGALPVAVEHVATQGVLLDLDVGLNAAVHHPGKTAPNDRQWHWASGDENKDTDITGESVVVIF